MNLSVRKDQAGSSSHGHVWAADGDVVEVPVADAYELIRIPDGGFAIVEDKPGKRRKAEPAAPAAPAAE